MSPADRSVRYGKFQTNHAITRAYARLAKQPCAGATFAELLLCVQQRARRLLDAPIVDGCHLGVEALFNLTCCQGSAVRTVESWTGSGESWRVALDSLAQHLLGKYGVPRFLSAAWYATDPYADAKRRWFIAHASGVSFRSMRLPIRLTSRMEHILLCSRDHFGIEYALRRAELLGLGADGRLTDAVLAARPAIDLANGQFWRTVWHFLIANADLIDLGQVGPIIDFLHAIRHERVAVESANGIVFKGPPQPQFTLKGRTARSVMRLMDEWHRSLGRTTGGLSWERSRFRPWVFEITHEDPSLAPTRWELTELTNSAELRLEGARLRHCVASYSYSCWSGRSRIFSLRRGQGLNRRSILTVEVHPRDRTIVQALGFRNRRAYGQSLRFVRQWADREKLRLSL